MDNDLYAILLAQAEQSKALPNGLLSANGQYLISPEQRNFMQQNNGDQQLPIVQQQGQNNMTRGLYGNNFAVSGSGGSNEGIFGRIGLKSIPLADNTKLGFGVSGGYDSTINRGVLGGYDARIDTTFGNKNQHNIGIQAERTSGLGNKFLADYQYKF